jgi:chemotaxis protein CheD
LGVVAVGIADCRLSQSPDDVLVTYALGSCVGVAIYDPVAKVGGLLHYMLPESGLDRDKARDNPHMFADTGIPLLFRRSYELGAEKRRLVVCVAGGAQVMDDAGVFNIGKRNALALRKILWKAGVLIHRESLGGAVSRTVRMEMGTGRVWLRSDGLGETEMGSQSKGGLHCAS